MGVEILKILKNKYIQLVLAFGIGAAIGVIFYPSKSTETREKIQLLERTVRTQEKELDEKEIKMQTAERSLQESTTSFKTYREHTGSKIESLRTENSSLKQSAKRQKFRIVKPDGTVIEKEFEESSSEKATSVIIEVREEFTRKVESIESKWKQIHETRVLKIKDSYEKKLKEKKTEIKIVEKIVEKEKIVKVNEKKLRTELGYSSDDKVYTHASYPIWGPVFLGGGVSIDRDMKQPEARIGVGIDW